MSDKRCPNCGACKECGHAPPRFNPYPYFYPYVNPPYYVGTPPNTGLGNTVTWNVTQHTAGGSYQ